LTAPQALAFVAGQGIEKMAFDPHPSRAEQSPGVLHECLRAYEGHIVTALAPMQKA
jgi:hypothetical protein